MGISKKLLIGTLVISFCSLVFIACWIDFKADRNTDKVVDLVLDTVKSQQGDSIQTLGKEFADVEKTVEEANAKAMEIMLANSKKSYKGLLVTTATQIFPMIEGFDFAGAKAALKSFRDQKPAIKWAQIQTKESPAAADLVSFGEKQAEAGNLVTLEHQIKNEFAFLKASIQVDLKNFEGDKDEMAAILELRGILDKINTDNKSLFQTLGKSSQENLVKAHAQSETNTRRMDVHLRWQVLIGVLLALAVTSLAMSIFVRKWIIVPINTTIGGLITNSDQVAQHAKLVAESSVHVSDSTQQQAASLEETSASLEQISSMTNLNAENSGEANKLMTQIHELVTKSNTLMTDLVKAMEEIFTASSETAKINQTIDGIAFQTNLLALNAAVEAARAGEAGAGFAVVAEEVRNLALRAAQSSKNSEELINKTLVKVKNGAELSKNFSVTFSLMSELISKGVHQIDEITRNSVEQSKGLSQLNVSVADQDKLVQQNALEATSSETIAKDLGSQASRLDQMIGELKELVGGDASSLLRPVNLAQTVLPSPKKHSGKLLT